MTYSYSQINQYLACPRGYRYRYFEGWREKDTRANLLFGRVFERALTAYFQGEDSGQRLHDEWAAFREAQLDYGRGDTWASMLTQGIQLLERFCQEDRVHIVDPKAHLQMKVVRQLSSKAEFISYVDAMGELDGISSIIEWKTSSARYCEEPQGILALDPQLLCYSWMTRQPEVAMVVFVRKRSPEIQYLRTSISDEQRQQYEELVRETVHQIESARFLQHSGIRFPHNTCVSCPFIGLCLCKQDLVVSKLLQGNGEDLDWHNQLDR
jgi:CRISPR/Cas system-associated exonuclease Cas4 (RecB family)